MKCAGCHQLTYCSRLCQKRHWKQHKSQCCVASSEQASAKSSQSVAPKPAAEAAKHKQSIDAVFANLIALGRTTEAEYDRATDALAAGTKTEAALVAEWAPLGLEVGASVVLKGLKGRTELNGCDASVVEYRLASQRFLVKLAGGETIAAKRENLEEFAGAEPAALLVDRLGSDVASLVGSFLKCTRCGEPCVPGSKCRVPHPKHLCRELGALRGPEGMRSSFGCTACQQQYDVVTQWTHTRDGGLGPPGEPRLEGVQWCYAGVHTTQPLPPSDQRRVFPNTVALKSGPNLQREIDVLPADVQTLTISSGNGFFDDEAQVVFERHLPDLVTLSLVDVSFSKVVLNKTLTPSLRRLRMQNVPDECDLALELPNLREVSIHFLGDCDEVINTMLAHATSLETFDSYKLWVGELHFASNELVEVDLHRSDALDTLTLYAPNLRKLGLQACYGLNNLTFRKVHPTLSALLPKDHRPPPLEVNTTNAILGPRVRKALREHPRVVQSSSSHPGMPTEAMFAGMSGMMGGMMGGMGDEDEDEEEDDEEGDDDDYYDHDDDHDDDDASDEGADPRPAQQKPACAQDQAKEVGAAGAQDQAKEVGAAGAVADDDHDFCCVCLDAPKQFVFGPCGHVCVCETCASEIMQTAKECPMCRTPALTAFKVFWK